MRSVGRYEILREIGRGGMATVYLARQTDLDRLVALKELSALAAADAVTARRFLRESRLAGSLNHPNIVTVHDFFEHQGTPYIAMEYLDRGSLRPLMTGLPLAQIASVIEGLLAGLRHAHERGIVHRDVKPENLMITDETARQDRGLRDRQGDRRGPRRHVPDRDRHDDRDADVHGPRAGDGRAGRPMDRPLRRGHHRVRAAVGRPPFDASGTPMAVLLRHVNEKPLTLRAVRPSADPRLSDWIDALLATDVADRTQSAATASLAFEEIVLDEYGPRRRTPPTIRLSGVTERTIMPAAAAAAAAAPVRPGRPPSARRALGLARLLVLVAGFAVAIAAGLSVVHDDGPSRAGAAPAASQREAARERRSANRERPQAGVGDSQSDDPSDDEEDGPEP